MTTFAMTSSSTDQTRFELRLPAALTDRLSAGLSAGESGDPTAGAFAPIWFDACRQIERLLDADADLAATAAVVGKEAALPAAQAAATAESPTLRLPDGRRLTLNLAEGRLIATTDGPLSAAANADALCVQGCLSAILTLVGGTADLVDAAGQHQLLEFGDGGPGHATGPMTIIGQFDAVAARRPDAIALEGRVADQDAPRRRWTYAELDQATRQAAQRLADAGVQPGDIVVSLLPRTAEAVAALLAIIRAGAAYTPIDPSFPIDRVRTICRDAAARVLIVDASTAATAAEAGGTAALLSVATLFPVQPDLQDAPAVPWAASRPTGPADLAYMIYTSGSTGKPKGTRISQRAVVLLAVGQDYVTLDDDTVLLQVVPHSFDVSTFEVWGALLNGGRCVVHEERVPSAAGLGRTIRNGGVNTAWLTGSLFNRVIDDDPTALAGLATLVAGGEALSPPHVRKALDHLPSTRFVNGYGPTEATTFAVAGPVSADDLVRYLNVPIGRPLCATVLRIVTPAGQLTPVGIPGELLIGGPRVADGYHGRPELTAERFVADPLGQDPGRFYRTGDRVRWLDDGRIEYLGRIDSQLKIRGQRVEPGEVETVLLSHPTVAEAAVLAMPGLDGSVQLVAWLSPRPGTVVADDASLRDHCRQRLPVVMMPARFQRLERLPMTVNGKLDRKALPAPGSEPAVDPQPMPAVASPAPQAGAARGSLETSVRTALAGLLALPTVGRDDNFFEIGGTSLLAARAIEVLNRQFGAALSIADIFGAPTPGALARRLAEAGITGIVAAVPASTPDSAAPAPAPSLREPIAIIGMAGRFPGSDDIEALWRNLLAGHDGIRHFGADELDPSLALEVRNDPDYVAARGILNDVDQFDAAFFGISPAEAELMDPQQRVFLELAWTCLERAGHPPQQAEGPVGVFAGMYNGTYFLHHVQHHPERIAAVGEFQVMLANEKDYIATRTAHRLNLSGPAVSVHTACSTSLVAVVEAVNSLRLGQCRMALAGGVAITCPPDSGYRHEAGAMLSPDGRTRTFDADAGGTVFSDGAAVVLLKRLADAIADRDTIHAVIRGVAINNDGADKASFTAPSVNGQVAVIRAALADAGVPARSISYVEAHGTATPMGDPIEVAALTRAWRVETPDRGFAGIGSIKSAIGHTVVAAGAAGLIKTALALEQQCIPRTLHFKAPNPAIDFAASPVTVVAENRAWPRTALPRRAAVTSLGVGGTNAHVIVEEAPAGTITAAANDGAPWLLPLSARTATALASQRRQLADFLEQARTDGQAPTLADVAWTLRHGRTSFRHRAVAVAADLDTAVARLREPLGRNSPHGDARQSDPEIVFCFSGQGSQYPGMGRELYRRDARFRAHLDRVLAAIGPVPAAEAAGHADLKDAMFNGSAETLACTAITQPALFALQVALADRWRDDGIVPAAVLGHSIGEYAAAVVAGVFSVAGAGRLVVTRGALAQALPAGRMLAVELDEATVLARLPAALSLAAMNGPRAVVVAGPIDAIAAFADQLEAEGITHHRLTTSHAFHSTMMAPALAPLRAAVAAVTLNPPVIALISSVSGRELDGATATDPGYWSAQLREPVRFHAAATVALAGSERVALEIGPRAVLTGLVRQQQAAVVASLGQQPDDEIERRASARAFLWSLGVNLADAPSDGRRVRLPTYPFERRRHWVDAPVRSGAAAPSIAAPTALAVTAVTTEADVSPAAVPMTTKPMPSDRKPALLEQVTATINDVCGLGVEPSDAERAFVDLGLDSLLLTQLALQLKRRFAQPITFRLLMESLSSPAAVTEWLDDRLPAPDPAAESVSVASALTTTAAIASPATAIAASATIEALSAQLVGPTSLPAAGANGLQQLIATQLTLMARQLELLSGAGANAATPSVPTTPSLPATPAMPAAAPVAVTPPTATATGTAATATGTPAAEGRARYDVKSAFGAIARIHGKSASALDPRQEARIDALIRRYVQRTPKSRAYTEQHRPHLADPRVVNGFRPRLKEMIYQIVVDRSRGTHLWDIDGNEYVDVLSGFGMSLFGWQPDFVVDAVRKMLDSGYEIGPQHPLAGEVAQLLCELTGFERAGLCNTGSEAVMGATRIARTVTGRDTLVVFSGSYHGIFDEVIVRASPSGRSMPAAPGILPDTARNVVVLEYGADASLDWIRAHGETLAGILVEPVQSRRPDLQPREFLHRLREITHDCGALLIFDEVITGFRTAPGGAQEHFGIRADLASYGKVIGGGFPIGVIAGKREYIDALDGGHWQYGDDSVPSVGVTYFAGTFVRHPLALVAAHAVLTHLKTEGPALQQRITRTTAALADELNAFCRQTGAPIELRHFGSVWRIAFTEDHPWQDLLFPLMRMRGIHILDNFPCFMTTAHDDQDIARIKMAFRESIAELQEGGFLPGTPLAEATPPDASRPPVPGARLGRDASGRAAWFVPDPQRPGRYIQLTD